MVAAPDTRAAGAGRMRPASHSTAAGWRHRLAFWLVLAVFAGAGLAWSLAAAVLARVLPRPAAATLGQWAIMWGFRGGVSLMRRLGLARFDLAALDALRDAGPCVVVCNHLSLLDAVLVVSRLPRAVLIAKAGLWRNPALAGGMRLAGYLRNDAPVQCVRAGRQALREGRHVVVFPEGTRGDGASLGAFRPGFAALAREAGVPVATVLLSCDTPCLGPGTKLTRTPPMPAAYRLRLGRRFRIEGSSAEAARAVERYMRAELFS